MDWYCVSAIWTRSSCFQCNVQTQLNPQVLLMMYYFTSCSNTGHKRRRRIVRMKSSTYLKAHQFAGAMGDFHGAQPMLMISWGCSINSWDGLKPLQALLVERNAAHALPQENVSVVFLLSLKALYVSNWMGLVGVDGQFILQQGCQSGCPTAAEQKTCVPFVLFGLDDVKQKGSD